MIEFSAILKAINYEINNEIKDGKIKNPLYDRNNNTISFCVSFPYVISPNALIELNFALRDRIVRVGLAKEVEIFYE